MPRPLSLTPAFRGIREQILTRYPATPTCPDCGVPVEPQMWSFHRNQMCSGKPAARVSPDDGPRE